MTNFTTVRQFHCIICFCLIVGIVHIEVYLATYLTRVVFLWALYVQNLI